MRSFAFAIPGDLTAISGGYAYDRAVIAHIGAHGWRAHALALADGFPDPADRELAATTVLFAAIPTDSVVLVDGLALGAMPEIAALEAARLRLVALVHHPLALENGISPERASLLRATETEALRHVRHVVTTSPETARVLARDFGVAADRITAAVPGTEPGPQAKGGNTPPHLVAVGALIPRKGHDLLIEALGRIRHRDWRVTLAGSQTADSDWAARLSARVAALGFEDRIHLAGPRGDVRALMAEADVFVLPSRYEGYGMAFAEALSQGLPVVACRAGAVPDVVPDTAGLLVPVDDVVALADALEQLVVDPALRQRLAEGAQAAGRLLPGWAETAGIIARVLDRVAA